MPSYTYSSIYFSEHISAQIDNEMHLGFGDVNIGQRGISRETNGGLVGCQCLLDILHCVPCIAKVLRESKHFTDLGCSVGNAVLCLALNRPSMHVYGIDNDAERVDYLKDHRLPRYKDHLNDNVTVMCMDMANIATDQLQWHWMSDKGIVFVNNINFGAIVNLGVENIIWQYAQKGTVIISLSPLFISKKWNNHIQYVYGRGRGGYCILDVPQGHVSWAGGNIQLLVYVYELKSTLPRV